MLTRTDLYARLCFYDRRNPNGVYAYGEPDPDDLPNPNTECHCDACFYGRSRLADALLAAWDRIEELEN